MGYITKEKHISERVISIDGVAFIIMAMTHGYGQGFIYEDDTCRTIKSQYQQTSSANFVRHSGGYAAIGVIEYESDESTKRHDR